MFKYSILIDFIGFNFNFPYFSTISEFFIKFYSILLIMATMPPLKSAKIVKNIHFYITKIIMIENDDDFRFKKLIFQLIKLIISVTANKIRCFSSFSVIFKVIFISYMIYFFNQNMMQKQRIFCENYMI